MAMPRRVLSRAHYVCVDPAARPVGFTAVVLPICPAGLVLRAGSLHRPVAGDLVEPDTVTPGGGFLPGN